MKLLLLCFVFVSPPSVIVSDFHSVSVSDLTKRRDDIAVADVEVPMVVPMVADMELDMVTDQVAGKKEKKFS